MVELDTTTIIATAAFVAGMSGAFLVVAGGKLRAPPPATIWGVSNIFTALAMMLVMQGTQFGLAFLALMAASQLCLLATSNFDNRSVPLTYYVAGPTVWVVLELGPWPIDFGLAASIVLTITAVYFVACAYLLYLGRESGQRARLAVIALVSMNALAVLVAAAEFAGFRVAPDFALEGALWIVYVATVAFTIGTAMFVLAMTKEREIAVSETAARTDALTGLLNRYALSIAGAQALERAAAEGIPLAVALFDLDHFKNVNDTYGHRTGDAVLCRFAASARRCIRGDDLFARVGGEEFAAIIPGADSRTALAFAERVRKAFADGAVTVDGERVTTTVSSGVAIIEPGEEVTGLAELLARADTALYVAKASGRDCVSLGRSVPVPEQRQPAEAQAMAAQ